MKYQKHYIGKGQQVENFDIIRYSICLDAIDDNLTHEFNGKRYLTFEAARLLETTKFGKTHTIYVSRPIQDDKQPEMELVEKAAPKTKGGKKRK